MFWHLASLCCQISVEMYLNDHQAYPLDRSMPSLIAQHVSPLEDDAFRSTDDATARIVCGG